MTLCSFDLRAGTILRKQKSHRLENSQRHPKFVIPGEAFVLNGVKELSLAQAPNAWKSKSFNYETLRVAQGDSRETTGI